MKDFSNKKINVKLKIKNDDLKLLISALRNIYINHGGEFRERIEPIADEFERIRMDQLGLNN
jgi:hypothetical protein